MFKVLKEDVEERKDTFVYPPRLCELLCTVDQPYFPLSLKPDSLAILEPPLGEASIKEESEEASWGKFTECDGEVILDKKGV